MPELRTLKRSVLKLTQARNLLLPRLMNGEIAVWEFIGSRKRLGVRDRGEKYFSPIDN